MDLCGNCWNSIEILKEVKKDRVSGPNEKNRLICFSYTLFFRLLLHCELYRVCNASVNIEIQLRAKKLETFTSCARSVSLGNLSTLGGPPRPLGVVRSGSYCKDYIRQVHTGCMTQNIAGSESVHKKGLTSASCRTGHSFHDLDVKINRFNNYGLLWGKKIILISINLSYEGPGAQKPFFLTED